MKKLILAIPSNILEDSNTLQDKTQKIGVIGTYSTIQSGAYKRMFKNLGDVCSVQEISCPLFVPIIEEGWADTSIATNIAEISIWSKIY